MISVRRIVNCCTETATEEDDYELQEHAIYTIYEFETFTAVSSICAKVNTTHTTETELMPEFLIIMTLYRTT